VAVSLADTTQMIFDEYIVGLTLPTHLAVLTAPGLAGPILVDFDLGLAHAAVDRLLGGSGRLPDRRTEPTSIEAALIERIFADIPPAISDGWAHLEAIELRVTETALGTALLRVAAPSDVVAVLTFEVHMPGVVAPLTMCYPHEALEPLLPRLSATAWYAQRDRPGSSAIDRVTLETQLRQVPVSIAAVLGDIEVTLEELAALRAGDVIRFDDPADGPVVITIDGRARAWAVPGRVGDRIALRLTSGVEALEA
jgi:flagellar motor switch protein FliM